MLKRLFDIYSPPVEPKIPILVHVNYKTQLVFSVHVSTFFINLTIFLQVLNKCLTC